MEAEELEHNLRLFAMRKAAAASKEFSDLKSRVVVSVQSQTRNCPMHGGKNSRKEMARELRLSAAKEAREARERSLEISSSRRGSNTPRSQSLEPFNSTFPRRMSSNLSSRSINRHGSFQEVPAILPKKDTFTPRVDFKNTLRKFDPKDDERSRGQQRSRHDSEPMDYHDSNAYFTQQLTAHNPYALNPKRNMMASDLSLDSNSGPASLPITLSSNKRPFKLKLDSKYNSPANSRPQSPRRVEFSDEVFFNFGGHRGSISSKPILRNSQTPSLIEQFEQNNLPEPLSPLVIEHTNLEAKTSTSKINQRKISNEDSLVQIFVPNEFPSDDETLSAASENECLSLKNEVKRTLSAEVTASRKVPPMLSDWNRSQSFPPPVSKAAPDFESDGLQRLRDQDKEQEDQGKNSFFYDEILLAWPRLEAGSKLEKNN